MPALPISRPYSGRPSWDRPAKQQPPPARLAALGRRDPGRAHPPSKLRGQRRPAPTRAVPVRTRWNAESGASGRSELPETPRKLERGAGPYLSRWDPPLRVTRHAVHSGAGSGLPAGLPNVAGVGGARADQSGSVGSTQ